MSDICLSICMPTYNFGKFIGETLDSILPQMTDNVEIVIVDGGSTDNTQEVVAAYLKKSPRIKYHRLPKRGGIDADMHAAVELSSGEYCWLFSSDDVMKPGCLKKMMDRLQLPLKREEGYRFSFASESAEIEKVHADIVICGLEIYSLDLKELICKHPVSEIKEETLFDFAEREERLYFFQKAITTTAFFSFMSSLAFKRSRWMETKVEESFFGGCWAHAARMLRMIPDGLKVMYIPESYLDKRAYNDSFMDKGFIHRLGIAIDGYHLIADKLFGHESEEAFHIRRVLRNEIKLGSLVNAKGTVRSCDENERLLALAEKNYCDFPYYQKFQSILLKVITPLMARAMLKTYRRLQRFRPKRNKCRTC